jgi:RNA polymerase sigma-70 factor, ECF subfamily
MGRDRSRDVARRLDRLDQQCVAAGARDACQKLSRRPAVGGAAAKSGAAKTARPLSARAWEGHDLEGFVALLKEDATFTMPPWPQWYAGRQAIGSFFALAWRACGGLRLLPTAANGQPAFAVYERSAADGRWAAHAIQVLTLQDEMISTMTLFVPPAGPRLFDAFGLPLTLPDAVG